jgi:hypothetical protein
VATVAGVGIHTLAMAATTGMFAVFIYEWVALDLLRRAFVAIDQTSLTSTIATASCSHSSLLRLEMSA